MRKLFQFLSKVNSYLILLILKKYYEFREGADKQVNPSQVTLRAIDSWLTELGIKEGSTLFVHSSWMNLDSGKIAAPDLVKLLVNKVGESGTLAMPAFPQNQDPNVVFNVKRTPSGAGLLTEVFRRFPGVKRSINLNHSVCALGKNVDFLLGEHHKSLTSWDEYSPYYKLGQIEDAWIVGLGVGHRLNIATSLHCVESILWQENRFYKKLFPVRVCYEYKDAEGNLGNHCYRKRIGEIFPAKIAKYFSKDELIEATIQGLDVYAIRANTLISKSIELGRLGKNMYIWPIPFWWYFK